MRLRALGTVEIVIDDIPVALRSNSIRTVLAALLMEPDTVIGVEDLVDFIWGATPPASAVNQIQVAVSRLRATFAQAGVDPSMLATQPPGYRLNLAEFESQVRLDITDFRRAANAAETAALSGDWGLVHRRVEEALRLWRGPAFQDVSSPRMGAFALRLQQERQSAFERLCAAELLLGRAASAAARLSEVDNSGRERLWYLKIAACALDGRTQEALSAYQEARRLLIDGFGLEPGIELRELERLVLAGRQAEALGVIEAWLAPGRIPAAVPFVAPRQLPPDLPHLVGRNDELAMLDRLLVGSSRHPVIVAISGIGGVGKTATAVRAANVAAQRFSDGSLFMDMRGVSPDAADPHAVMGRLLRALGVPGPGIPQDPQERLGFYRSLLSTRRVLIVLDNVQDEQQIRSLIPTAGSALLVTSRQPLSGLDGVSHVDMRALGRHEAIELLGAIVGAERVTDDPHAAKSLVDLCGRLPLAIRIAGVRLGRRPDLTLAAMVRRLADERFRLDELSVGDQSVRASLALSWARLSPDATDMLGRLSHLPAAEFPSWAARQMGDERLLDRLIEAHLITVVPATSPRFQLHDLVRLYACEHSPASPDTDTAVRRTHHRLLRLALAADSALPARRYPTPFFAEPDLPAEPDPTGWFEREMDFLCATVRDALRRGWSDEAWRLVTAMTNFVGMRARLDEWTELLHLVLQHQSTLDPQARAALLLAKGGLPAMDDVPGSMRAVRTARRLYMDLGDPIRAASAAIQLGTWHRVLRRERTARAAYTWAIGQLSDQDSPGQEGWARIGLGNLEMQLAADPAQAATQFEQALTLLRKAGDRMGEANALGCLGAALQRLGDQQGAVGHLREALTVHREICDPTGQGMVETALSELHAELGDPTEALYWNDRALATLRGITYRPGEARACTIRGTVLIGQLRWDEATAMLERANDVWRELGAASQLAHGERLLAQARDKVTAKAPASVTHNH